MGDPAGIGGELILKALEKLASGSIPVIVGDAAVLESMRRHMFQGAEFRMKPLGQAAAGEAEFVDVGAMKGEVRFGVSDAACGEASHRYLKEALKLIFSGSVSAVVTCPINKKSIRAAGMPFPGHTELFAHYAGVADYVMMMQNRRLKGLPGYHPYPFKGRARPRYARTGVCVHRPRQPSLKMISASTRLTFGSAG